MANEQSRGCDGASAGLDFRLMIFHSSPNAGDPDCICSLCLNGIEEEEVPIRIYGMEKEGSQRKGVEMRFHEPCFKIVSVVFLSIIEGGSENAKEGSGG